MNLNKKQARLALAIIHKNEVNRTALNKLLFFCDVASIRTVGLPISDARYVKMQHGPVPEGIEQTRTSLISNGAVEKESYVVGGYLQHTYQSKLSNEDFGKLWDSFDVASQSIIESVVRVLGCRSAKSLSDLSHAFGSWKEASWYSPINLENIGEDPEVLEILDQVCEA